MDLINTIVDVAPVVGGVLTVTAALINAAVAFVGRRREREREKKEGTCVPVAGADE